MSVYLLGCLIPFQTENHGTSKVSVSGLPEKSKGQYRKQKLRHLGKLLWLLKGTVTQDFNPLLFFRLTNWSGPLIDRLKYFKYGMTTILQWFKHSNLLLREVFCILEYLREIESRPYKKILKDVKNMPIWVRIIKNGGGGGWQGVKI